MSLQYQLTELCDINDKTPNTTAKSLRQGCRYFAQWAKAHGLNKLYKLEGDKAKPIIQAYANALTNQGYAPATIHRYLYAPCKALGVAMGEIQKPKRASSAILRSRSAYANLQGKQECQEERFSRLVAFQKAVGIRRNELAKLTGKNLVQDESSHLCVRVERGKGGKEQLQRILPQDEATVKAIFQAVGKDQLVFSQVEMNNKIDLHGIRAEHARDCYQYYASLSKEEREKLALELCCRYAVCHPNLKPNDYQWKRFLQQISGTMGDYRLRGDNYNRALLQGRPTTYDRLALMAVSVFHLSHWRLDVTVTNYLL